MFMMYALAAFVQPPVPPTSEEDAIVITAQRTGIPVWKIKRGNPTVVLVGTLDDVATGTKWNARALDATVAQSRRVIFPQTQVLRTSQAGVEEWNRKWKAMASLPNGQSLSSIIDPADASRLSHLVSKGLAPRDWDAVHPLHLAIGINELLRRRTGIDQSVEAQIDEAIRTHKVYRVPIKEANVDDLLDVFSSKPRDHVACLKASLAVAEAGPEELRRRSAAWAKRDVAAAVSSPVEAIETHCWQPGNKKNATAALIETTRRALRRKGVTLAIVNLDTLARRDGLLDRLAADGAAIDGPPWR